MGRLSECSDDGLACMGLELRARSRMGDDAKTEPCASPFPLEYQGDDELTLADGRAAE